MEKFPHPSTGLDHLDELLTRLQYGDNVVWQVDDIAHYKDLVIPYVNRAIAEHRKTIYIRFAQHAPLLEPQPGLTIVELDADTGFETFSTQVHQIISQQGKGTFVESYCVLFRRCLFICNSHITLHLPNHATKPCKVGYAHALLPLLLRNRQTQLLQHFHHILPDAFAVVVGVVSQ